MSTKDASRLVVVALAAMLAGAAFVVQSYMVESEVARAAVRDIDSLAGSANHHKRNRVYFPVTTRHAERAGWALTQISMLSRDNDPDCQPSAYSTFTPNNEAVVAEACRRWMERDMSAVSLMRSHVLQTCGTAPTASGWPEVSEVQARYPDFGVVLEKARSAAELSGECARYKRLYRDGERAIRYWYR